MNTELRKGPWTVEEDMLLNNYITIHGEGRWNSLARCAGDYASPHIMFYVLFIYLIDQQIKLIEFFFPGLVF